MVRVMFVCHGNICRSPMAECIMRKLVQDEGMGASILVDSAGTSDEEAGTPSIRPPRRNSKSTASDARASAPAG